MNSGELSLCLIFLGFVVVLTLIISIPIIWHHRRRHLLDVCHDFEMLQPELKPGLSPEEYWKLQRQCKTEEGRQKITDFISIEIDGKHFIPEEYLPPFLQKDLSLCPYCQQEIELGYIIDTLGHKPPKNFEVAEFYCPHCNQRVVCEIEAGFAVWDIRKADDIQNTN